MSKASGSALIFNEDELRMTKEIGLPRLVRVVFYGLGITNDGYIRRYANYWREAFPNKTQKEFSQKAAADRKFLLERGKLTFNMMRNIIFAMGYNVESISIVVSDKLTGDIRTFSTNDTVDNLKAVREKESQVGVDSFM